LLKTTPDKEAQVYTFNWLEKWVSIDCK
jgi:hypothetical protein